MSNPIIADNKSVKVSLSKGQEYHFCTCGRAKSQQFCDASHVGTSFQKLNIGKLSKQLHNFFDASVELMQVMACAVGHND